MAKCIFHPNIQGYNGSIINKTHNFKTRIKHVRAIQPGGIVRPKGARKQSDDPISGKRRRSVKQINLEMAFIICNNEWNKLLLPANASAYATWDMAAVLMSATLDYDITAHQLFQGYFMTKYSMTLTTSVFPAQITAGTSYYYDDRDSRTWL